jgi:hypothetical protein
VLTQTDRDPEQILELLISAAGNADAVRLASLVHNATQAGVDTFNRQWLETAWAQRWRHHLTGPPNRRPPARVARSLPVLIGVTALASIDGPDLKADDLDILQFLADRVYLAESLDVQAPTSNTLPVGEHTRAAAAALVAAAVNAAASGEGALQAQGDVLRAPAPGDLGGTMTLSVSGEVIKGGSPPPGDG